jgi:hypothetical protein
MLVITLFRLAENKKYFDKNLVLVYKNYNVSVTLVSESYDLLYYEKCIYYLSIKYV